MSVNALHSTASTEQMAAESNRSVYFSIVCDFAIAAAKFVAASFTGSSAMLATPRNRSKLSIFFESNEPESAAGLLSGHDMKVAHAPLSISVIRTALTHDPNPTR
jgi:hypothetical protein